MRSQVLPFLNVHQCKLKTSFRHPPSPTWGPLWVTDGSLLCCAPPQAARAQPPCHGLQHSPQGNLWSSSWSTSCPFLTALGVCRALFSHSSATWLQILLCNNCFLSQVRYSIGAVTVANGLSLGWCLVCLEADMDWPCQMWERFLTASQRRCRCQPPSTKTLPCKPNAVRACYAGGFWRWCPLGSSLLAIISTPAWLVCDRHSSHGKLAAATQSWAEVTEIFGQSGGRAAGQCMTVQEGHTMEQSCLPRYQISARWGSKCALRLRQMCYLEMQWHPRYRHEISTGIAKFFKGLLFQDQMEMAHNESLWGYFTFAVDRELGEALCHSFSETPSH